jgi:pyrroline-5-carboxylate reductase
MKLKLGILGIGNMGFPVYQNIPDTYDILVYDPHTHRKDIPQVSLESILELSDILLLCVKPDKIESILKEIKAPKKIISIAAGIPLSFLELHSPLGSQIIRIMPNLPLVVGQGVIACYGDRILFSEVKSIFQNTGLVFEVANENEMDIVTALSGSGPAYVFTFLHALAEGGLKCGMSYPQALQIAIQTLKGSIIYFEEELKKKKEIHPYQLRNQVASPGGTTIYGLDSMEKNMFNHTVMEAVYTGFMRAKELGKKKD